MAFNKATDAADIYWIEREEQLALLESPTRQEILAAMEASGPLTVPEMARELGRHADGLYYHVDLLREGGLLREAGTRETRRRDATLYRLPARQLGVRYPLGDPEGMARIRRLASVMLRAGERDFEAGAELPWADANGDRRNLWTARVKGWLSGAELEQVNRHLDDLVEIFAGASRTEDSRLATLTWVLAPVEDRPVRRGVEEEGTREEDLSRLADPGASTVETGA